MLVKWLKRKKKIILNEIVPCSLGVEIANDKYDSFVKHGDKMFTIIKRNMELSKNVKEQFKILLKKQKVIKINFYEGESKFVKYNQKIGDIEIEIPDAQLGSIINYEINFEVDTYFPQKKRMKYINYTHFF
jgi:molecular chaperone HscC